ncbi:MAG: M1 family aminopeptidase [Desulfuromonadales bacterium]|nr:M1 family aminopeptidase [Desulfuromonadales bacterium]
MPNRRHLRSLLLLLLGGLLLPGLSLAASEPSLHHDLQIELDLNRQSIRVSDRMTLLDRTRAWPHAWSLAPQSRIDSVKADGRERPFLFERGRLTLPGLPTETRTISIAYRARFADPLPENTVGIEDPSYGITATIGSVGAYLSGAADWLPTAAGYPASHRISATGPAGLVTVSNGKLIDLQQSDNGTTTVWESRIPQQRLTLAAGFYQLTRDNLDDIQILVLLSGDNAHLAPRYLKACRDYLDLYRQLFGPYPYGKFAVVENFFPTGYGLPGWTLLGSSVVRLPFILTSSLPHEIAHAWWGNAVGIDYASGNWGEGLATYVADYLLKERSDPDEAREYRLKILREYRTLTASGGDFPLRDFRRRMSKTEQAVGYGKAAMVFHMLRRDLGDELFWQGLRGLAADFHGRTASWDDLRRQFAAVSGRNLDHFFRQWLDQTGAPHLRLGEVTVSRSGAGWRVAGVIEQTGPLWQLELPLRLRTTGGEQTVLLAIDDETTRFDLQSEQRPLRLDADPDSHLLRSLDDSEIPPTVNRLRAAGKPLVVTVGEHGRALYAASSDLLRGLHWQRAPVVSEAQLSDEQLAGNDLLFFGWPEKSLPAFALPAGLDVKAGHFRLHGEDFATADDALFVVLDKENGSGAVGILQAHSPRAAADVARRISHYGRYSYLAFRNGNNRLKGSWRADQTPLSRTFESGIEP